MWLFWVQFEGVVWWSFRAVDESFGSVVDGSKGLTEIRRSCSKYVLSCKSRIIVEETTVSRHNFHQKLKRIEEGINNKITDYMTARMSNLIKIISAV